MVPHMLACRCWAVALLTCLWVSAAAAQPAAVLPESAQNDPLSRPIVSPPPPPDPGAKPPEEIKAPEPGVPLGFTGPTGIIPRDQQENNDFIPVEDRWRIGFPFWDRYGKQFPIGYDYPYKIGHWWDAYNQNVLKGDYPIIGQHTFLEISAVNFLIAEARQVPTPASGGFESTARPFEQEFFGRPNQSIIQNFTSLSFDLFHGDTKAFKPVDWRVKLTPVFNVNYLNTDELAVVNPDVRRGTDRLRNWWTLQEYFVETKIADLSPDYDFVSVRVGSQFFSSDFRGFVFVDTNRAVRVFGNAFSNRDQYNLAFFRQAEKETNSGLNSFSDRGQNIAIANYYHQDFIWPGYTAQVSVHYNNDPKAFIFDKNSFLVRPDPTGVFQKHQIDAVYLGWAGDGHINRFNIDHAFYWVLGRDSLNPIANQAQDISAQFAALEVSYDRDWARFRTSFMYASGDSNPNNSHATGFDSILDNPNFAGGSFSYFQRQAIGLFGVNLTQRESFLPDLRSSKIQGQSNFVNPGLLLFNLGADFDITPKLRSINNVNLMWFNHTQVLETFTFQDNIRNFIGTDVSTGVEYRPYLNNNIIVMAGAAVLFPGGGFKDLYNRLMGEVNPQMQAFMQVTLAY
ncbi:MAG: hypothetical protein K2R98_12875 [Gemmataceae bacterium]|nr:hypothetical protein [Gemmataceae bacterium]